jgi:hypothetical protein
MGDACTSATAFEPYGVADGSVLVRRTYYRLDDVDGRVTDGTIARVVDAFVEAFREATGVDAVPADVRAAVADAAFFTAEAYVGADADRRTSVVPAFYRNVAGFHCAYRGYPPEDGADR